MTSTQVSFAYIQGVPKMLGQNSAVSPSHKHIIQKKCPEICGFFSLMEILHATTNKLTIYYIT